MKALLPFVRMLLAHRGWVFAGMLLSLLTLLAAIGLLTLSGWFISASALAGVSVLSARQFNYFTPGAGVRGFAIARTVGRYFERVTTHEATFRMLAELRSWFYRRLEVLGPARLQAFRSADLLNRLVADINALDNLYLRVLVPTLVALAVSILVVLFIARYSPAIALLTTVALLLAGVLLPMLAQYAGRRLGRLQLLLLSRLRVRLLALVQGQADLHIYGGVDTSIQEAQAVERQLQRTQLRMALISGLTTAVLTIIAGVAGVGALVLGTELVLSDVIAPAHLAMLLFCVLAVFEAVAPLPLAYQYLSKTITAAERLNEVSGASAGVCYPDADLEVPVIPGQIMLRDVCMRYTEHAPLALDQLSLSVAPGEHVLVLGHTGSGKSSLINLLARFYDPEAGAVELSGCPVRSYSETTLRAQMSVLSQPVQLFAGSVADNLSLALPDASPSELLEVLRRVCLDQVLGDNPLEYQIGESGSRLSGGQRKRLALARALLKPSPLLVLDEPTEGLDAVTEAAVIKGVLDSCQGRTVLMISHHLQMANHFDRIIVLDRGCVIEAGTPVELAERPDSRYNQLRAL
ncbi:ATP-binding cassette subfamily C protein CydC [Marinobacterium halophilum]|uniref:ATP-binding cassette subfamily C protein CydC n=1 Tax=Marinobacterium halophilum TaxID=267374 RepID=A0A2P8F0C5_9GAMM|nr:thiol reductant ABC exporter subunit CydC [Marinobacterium halophilum]PSL15164.1 ATP-binding cassette subfamily C protein CydC [Marinobacterium halophilum]